MMATRGWELGKRSERKAVRQSAAQCSARSSAGATAGTRKSPSSTKIAPTQSRKLSGDGATVTEAGSARTFLPRPDRFGQCQGATFSRDGDDVNPAPEPGGPFWL